MQTLTRQEGPYSRVIDLNNSCPLAGLRLGELAKMRFKGKPRLPYVITILSSATCKMNYFDASALQAHFNQYDLYMPNTRNEPIQSVQHLFMTSFPEGWKELDTTKLPYDFAQHFIMACSDQVASQKRIISDLFKAQRWQECHYWATVVLRHAPKDMDTLKTQAELVLDSSKGVSIRAEEKVALLKAILELDPRQDRIATELGKLHLRGANELTPNLTKAKECFERAVAANSNNQESRRLLAEIRQKELPLTPLNGFHPPPAIHPLTSLLSQMQKVPQHLWPTLEEFFDIGRLDIGKLPEHPLIAFDKLQALVTACPDNAYAIARLAEFYRRGCPGIVEKNRNEALQRFLKACALSPQDPFITGRLGAIFMQNSYEIPRDKKKAHHYLTLALETDHDNIFALCSLAKLLLCDNENLLAAKVILETVIRRDPTNIWALRTLAGLLTTGCDAFAYDPEIANMLYQKAYELDPLDIKTIVGWAELLRIAGDGTGRKYTRARDLFQRACTLDPKNYFAKSRLAEILRKTARECPANLAVACELFLEVVTHRPTCAFSEARLGAMYLFGGQGVKKDLQAAEKWLRSAIAHDPHDAFALGHFGELQRQLNCDCTEAVYFFELALLKDPNHRDTLAYYGLLMRVGGVNVKKDFTKGTILLQRAWRIVDGEAPPVRPRCLSISDPPVGLMDYASTRELLENNLLQQPNNPLALIALAEHLCLSKESDDASLQAAEKTLKEALTQLPDHLDGIVLLADLYYNHPTLFSANVSDAITLYEKANQDVIRIKLAAMRIRRNESRRNDLAEAERHLVAANDKDARNPTTLALLGELYRLRNEIKRAQDIIEACLRLDPNHTDALITKAKILHSQDMIEEERELYQRVKRRSPANAEAQSGLAGAFKMVSLLTPVEQLEQELLQKPQDASLKVELARCYCENSDSSQDQKRRAEALLKDALKIIKGHFEAIVLLADLYRKNIPLFPGKVTEAIHLYKKAKEKQSGHSSIWLSLAYMYVKRNKNNADLQKAERLLTLARTKESHNPFLFSTSAELYRLKRDYDKAWQEIGLALRLDQTNAEALMTQSLLRPRAQA